MSEYRRLQGLAERQAALTTDAETKKAFEAIADDYRKMAEAEERKAQSKE